MNQYLTPFEKLLPEINDYQATIDTPIDENDLCRCLNESVQINSRTGKMLADATYYQGVALKSNILKDLKDIISLPPLTLNKLVAAYCKEENYVVNWIERVNKASDKKAKACITLISKQKAESFNQRFTT